MPIVTRCGTCCGSGVVNRLGPAIVRAASLERVVLIDKEPLPPSMAVGRKWTWEPGIQHPNPHQIPMFFLRKSDPDVAVRLGGLLLFEFDTREASLGWLSDRLRAWAKAH